jgi:hypothetical protein
MAGMHRIRLTYANVVASLALFVAIGGSSYAALSVTGAQVRDGSLTGRDVRNNSLTGKDVRNGTLRTSDFAAGQLPSGAPGPQGPKGDAGAAGPAGQKGDAGTAALHKVSKQFNLAGGEKSFLQAECPAGEKATGGGTEATSGDVRTLMSGPESVGLDQAPTGWAAGFQNDAGAERTVFVHVVCAP